MIPAQADTQKAINAFDRKDYNTAYREFLESARQGDAEAQAGVGSMLMMKVNPPGSGVYADAEAWLKRSADQGNTEGMTWLAKFYYADAQRYTAAPGSSNTNGNTIAGTGRFGDSRVAPTTYAHRAGINPSMSSGALSSFFGGRGNIPQQTGSANAPWVATPPGTRHFPIPAYQGSGLTISRNQQALREADLQKARYWFQKAAKRGDTYAMEMLALLMESGLGGPADPQGAAQWRAKMTHKTSARFPQKSINYPIAP